MKARRQQYDEYPKTSRSSDPPALTASRSSSLRNELLHSLRNNSKLQNLQQQQQQPVESVQTEDVAPSQQLQQVQSNTTLYPPPSGPPSPTNTTNNILRRTTSNESNRSLNQHHQSTPPRQNFLLSRLPTPRLALLTGSRKLISRLGHMSSLEQVDPDIETSPVCFLLEKPATLHELTIQSSDFLTGHILVCMHHKVSNIFKFIYNLRYDNKKESYFLSIYTFI
jgi:hypothetical protein